ncbi:MAG: hypothetical protein UV48_C0008G0029 [Candidatus Azambacteria bacterium GW2011_GWA2_42_9]|uniref:Uncharacterized protein n=2 Tax=Candidatus Azamiibacteriota TaxID=1752741 RepID=A0A0G0Z8Y5_9BACT|nr:MAG: hypothetical protein UV10_C0032G0001 [Candidatus Azambacteria bacterium GW2011_GWA1_42_19]KKS75689.1 MAG: hypothetical protein UV48_C0008G0029 [Candidatus Azambacteria bacterium GW2011_GWA2_42_9]KKS88549.1 MAG: hypothetical protein UV62_C0005G0003 [Parcubacteria group bacterium GW2011_GWC1_43_11]
MATDHERIVREKEILNRAIKAINMAHESFKCSDVGDALVASKIVGSLVPKIYDELKELDRQRP